MHLASHYRKNTFIISAIRESISMLTNMPNSVTRQRLANASLLDYANKNRDEGFFSDVTIVAGNESIPANRLVLSCNSPYFETMFKSSMRERYENTVEIQAVDGKSMKALIDFIYTGSVTIETETVLHLLSGADYLQLQEVAQFCFGFLQSNITPQNALKILKTAKLYRSDTLQHEVKQYIDSNFNEVTKTDEFKALLKQDLISLISNLHQTETTVTSLYQAVLAWTKHDKSRKEDFSELFKLIKFARVFNRLFRKSCFGGGTCDQPLSMSETSIGRFSASGDSTKKQSMRNDDT